jgi:putative transposase
MCAFLRDGVWENIRHHFVIVLREGAGRKLDPRQRYRGPLIL